MTSRLMDICPEVTTGGRESHPRIEISIYFLMLMHKRVGFYGFLCFWGLTLARKSYILNTDRRAEARKSWREGESLNGD